MEFKVGDRVVIGDEDWLKESFTQYAMSEFGGDYIQGMSTFVEIWDRNDERVKQSEGPVAIVEWDEYYTIDLTDLIHIIDDPMDLREVNLKYLAKVDSNG